ncbi:hypothetical protein ACET3Z_027811 [Daucus carota]
MRPQLGQSILNHAHKPRAARVVASQDWPDLTKYDGLVCTQAHGQELIQDLYKSWEDTNRGPMRGGIIRFSSLEYNDREVYKSWINQSSIMHTSRVLQELLPPRIGQI